MKLRWRGNPPPGPLKSRNRTRREFRSSSRPLVHLQQGTRKGTPVPGSSWPVSQARPSFACPGSSRTNHCPPFYARLRSTLLSSCCALEYHAPLPFPTLPRPAALRPLDASSSSRSPSVQSNPSTAHDRPQRGAVPSGRSSLFAHAEQRGLPEEAEGRIRSDTKLASSAPLVFSLPSPSSPPANTDLLSL